MTSASDGPCFLGGSHFTVDCIAYEAEWRKATIVWYQYRAELILCGLSLTLESGPYRPFIIICAIVGVREGIVFYPLSPHRGATRDVWCFRWRHIYFNFIVYASPTKTTAGIDRAYIIPGLECRWSCRIGPYHLCDTTSSRSTVFQISRQIYLAVSWKRYCPRAVTWKLYCPRAVSWKLYRPVGGHDTAQLAIMSYDSSGSSSSDHGNSV